MNPQVLRKGMIVVVIEGKAFGNPSDTVTKVLSAPGRISDQSMELCGVHLSDDTRLIMCDNPKSIRTTCNCKPASYELVSDLRVATKREKRKFNLNNNQPFLVMIVFCFLIQDCIYHRYKIHWKLGRVRKRYPYRQHMVYGI